LDNCYDGALGCEVDSRLNGYIAYNCFGELFSVFINDWPECDKSKAFDLVYSIADVNKILIKVLSAPTMFLSLEANVRALLRNIFLEQSTECEKDYGFWLTLILKPLPLIFQSQVLYMLTAPTDPNGMYLCLVCTMDYHNMLINLQGWYHGHRSMVTLHHNMRGV